jgi:signal transduction histidine kinase
MAANGAESRERVLGKVREITHEMSQPIQVILGLAELLAAGRADPAGLGADLGKIADQARRLDSLNQRLNRLAKTGRVD